ncbi:MAG TPA: hypothetical protein VF756_00575 [Thermoanaerobaculia bacterium]
MARETTQSGVVGSLQRLMGAMEENKEELPQLEPFRIKLGSLMELLLAANQLQAKHRAAKQQASKELRRLLAEAQLLASVVRVAVKEHYGTREEKIAEFGLQPFRGKKAKPSPEEPEPATKQAGDSGDSGSPNEPSR